MGYSSVWAALLAFWAFWGNAHFCPEHFPNNAFRAKAFYGNVDGYEIRNICKKELFFNLFNFKIFITHIGGKPPKYNKEVREKLNKFKPDIFICGHSHILNISKDDNFKLIYMNPGASGKIGFNKELSFPKISSATRTATPIILYPWFESAII